VSEQLALFPGDWTKRYRAVVARATANSLGIAKTPTREQLLATRRSVRLSFWTRRSGIEVGRRDIAADERLDAADEILLRASFRSWAGARGIDAAQAERVGRGHGGAHRFRERDATLSDEEKLQKKAARQQALRMERIAAGLCAACGKIRDREGKTCKGCLDVDRAWRADRTVRERTAEYLDAECQPLVLRKPARMLPIVGDRKDCIHEDDCVDELVDACGRQDAQGASCPKECASFTARDRRAQLELYASHRSGDD
jgi:hypothetical protein